ncbi:uncharacterized protein BO88DRAFT_372421 [Aspergillus vadensis CBS 113365]|uniref:Uncharacterized protein n=1 Tax=Aspergillus vadensis (strain CBS 113365 / IMI 142717 / IBT 24658) TaxID=1448311 RepID=A0A319BI12_ASPVC|nr:hypothetical protein BO88DRAFT_372421 [Aspergillus vadensis CBS 113365]PYH65443.1 hypothetical protein BO88DRAFT_372421 [Aspergillus vadensis CBS 113365]
MNHPATAALFTPNPMRPDHDQWGTTPQSPNNPSTTASKAAVVGIIKPSASLDKSTPIESLPFAGRGRQLSVPEQVCLVNLCAASMNDDDAHNHPKSFWIKISNKLELQTGRRYSWQSCRRRIQTYISKRKAHWEAYANGDPYPGVDIDTEVWDLLTSWLVKYNTPRDVTAKAPLGAAVALPTRVEPQPPQVPEPVRMVPEQGLVQISTKIERVLVWLKSLPPLEDMEAMRTWTGYVDPLADWMSRSKVRRERRLVFQKTKNGEEQPEFGTDGLTDPALAYLPQPHQPSVALHEPLQGTKRPRELDDSFAERPAQRIRVDPGSHPSGSPYAEEHADNAHLKRKLVESYFESTFGKLIDRLSARFRAQGAKQQDAPGSCEAIMRDLFKDVGVAVAKALVRMDEPAVQDQLPN